jgi:amino acid transporter
MPELPSSSTPAAHALTRSLGLRDLVLAQILCVVGSSWVGVAGGLGAAQTLMWIAAMLVFYLPMAAVVIALNTAMPLEGGLYIWAHRAFGPLGGFLTAWNLWIYGIAVTATILYATPTELAYLIGPSAAWLPEHHLASFAIVLTLVALITFAALRGLELGKWIHNVGGLAMLSVFVVLILLPLYGLANHSLTHGMNFALVLPRRDLRTLALFGNMLFGALCGLEYIAIFAGESRQPARFIGRSVWIASPIICAMFILGTSSVVAFATPGHIDYIAPIPQTLRIALGHSGIANLFAMAAIILVEFRLLGAASFLFTGVTRLPLALGWDNLVPAWFTRLHPRWRTPSNSILCTTGLILLLLLLASIGVHAQEAFQLLTNASLTHYEITYLVMFAIPFAGAAGLRKSLPRWLKWISLTGFLATLFSLLVSAFPFVDVVNPTAYGAKIIGTILFSNLIAVIFYLLRRRTPRTSSQAHQSTTEPSPSLTNQPTPLEDLSS